MITLKRTNAENKDFQVLVQLLDMHLKIKDGDEHLFFAQFNKIDMIKYVIVAYEHEIAIGCGAIKEYADKIMEIKRMFVTTEKRGNGVASSILQELEKWACELGMEKCILETGKRQTEAIQLYKKNNYNITANFGQYENIESSVCFEKEL